MADHYGAVSLDVPVVADAEPCGDPALRIVAGFLQAVINAHGTTAWRSVSPISSDGAKDGKDFPVCSAFAHDPANHRFSEKSLPALYVFRSQSTPFGDDAEDYRICRSTFTVWWIWRPTTEAKEAIRAPFANAVEKLVDASLNVGRDPAYVLADDADKRAPSYAAAPGSIKAAVATATTERTYTGAALNGDIGGDVMNPPRSPTVTLAGSAGAFIVGSLITWTGINALDQDVEVSVEVSGLGVLDAHYDLKRIDSVIVDAQANTAGTLAFGTAARTGLGTDIFEAARLQDIKVSRGTPKIINIQVRNDEVRQYDAHEILIDLEERQIPDLEQYDLLDDGDGSAGVNAGADVTFVREDESVIETAFYD
jgi:hypothetical protein